MARRVTVTSSPVLSGHNRKASGEAPSRPVDRRGWDAEYRRRRHIFVRFSRPRILALSRSFNAAHNRRQWLEHCSQAAFSVLFELGAYHPALVRTSAGWSHTVPSDPLWLESRPIVFSPAVYFASAEIALEGPYDAHLPEPVVPETFGDALLLHYLTREILSEGRAYEWRPLFICPLTELLLPASFAFTGKSYEVLFSEHAFGFIARGLSREWLNTLDALMDGDPATGIPVLQNLSAAMGAFRSLVPRDGWLYLLPFLWFYSDLFSWHSEETIISFLSSAIDIWRKNQQAKLEASQTAFRAVSGIFAPAVATNSWQSLSDIAEDGRATPISYRDPPLRAFLEEFSAFASVEGAVVHIYQRFARTFT